MTDKPNDSAVVPREPTEEMLDAAMNRYQHGSDSAARLYMKMHRENFRLDYKAMIAASPSHPQEKDAERYRFLRSSGDLDCPHVYGPDDDCILDGDDLDAAIDRAIKESGER